MKKHLLSLAVLLLFVLPAFAQKDFRPGYVVTLQNDTLRGFVNYKGDTKSALECTFKVSESAQAQTFKPDQINGYGFNNGRLYETHKIKPVNHPYNPVTRKFEEEPIIGQPEVNFMKILVKGTASLYYLVDVNAKPHFFLQNRNGELKELTVLEANVADPKTGWKLHRRLKYYTGVFTEEFADCAAVREQIEKTELKESSLMKLVTAYNHCVAPELTLIKSKKTKPVLSVGLLAGLSNSNLPFEANGFHMEIGHYESKPTFTAGATLDVTLPFLNEKLSLNNGLFYTQRNYTSNFYDHLESNFFIEYNVKFNLSLLRLENAIRYTTPFKTISPFVQAGIANSLVLNHSEEIIRTKHYESLPSRTEPPYQFFTPRLIKHQLGLVSGVGVDYNLSSGNVISLQLNYELNTGVIKGMGYNTQSHNLALMAGYRF